MIPTDIVNRMRVLAEQFRSVVPSVSDADREVSAVAAVGRVIAEVGPRLPDGRYQVFAAGQRFEMELPPDTQPGDRIALMLSADGGGGAKTPARPASEPLMDSVHLRVSDAGRFVDGLTSRNRDQLAPASLTSPEPLLPAAPVDAKATAGALREFIGSCGLFYESHQAQWLADERDLAAVRREPQARLKPLQHDAVRNTVAAAHDDAVPAESNASLSVPAERAGGTTAEPRPLLLHPATTELVQQQINALESQRIVWSGPIWPGQTMRWEIAELTRRESAPQAEPAWHTQIDLDLPTLGAITANLLLDARGLSVRLRTPVDSTGATLGAALAELRAALEAAGIAVCTLVRENHEPA